MNDYPNDYRGHGLAWWLSQACGQLPTETQELMEDAPEPEAYDWAAELADMERAEAAWLRGE